MAKRHEKKQEAARRMREQRAREQRRKQLKWAGGIVVVVLLVGALVAVVLSMSQDYEVNQPKADATQSALVLPEKDTEAKVKLKLYEDFICPACGSFQKQFGEQIQKAVEGGQVELEFHPLNFLDGQSSTSYSSRAANAAVCAADEDQFFAYEKQLFDNQPPEGGEGLSDKELVGFGDDLGLSGGFETCVNDQKYRGWVDRLTEKASADGVDSTPTVYLDGEPVDSQAFGEEFDKAIKKAYPDTEKDEKEKKD